MTPEFEERYMFSLKEKEQSSPTSFSALQKSERKGGGKYKKGKRVGGGKN